MMSEFTVEDFRRWLIEEYDIDPTEMTDDEVIKEFEFRHRSS